MHSGNKRVFFKDFVFLVDENVYEPAEDSFLFAENLDVKENEHVLDIGSGTGILGVVAAKKAKKVVIVDINPYAVHCSKENAILNGVYGNMAFILGSLFTPFNDRAKFDVILFNAPYLPTELDEEVSLLASAWQGGRTGRDLIDRFIIDVSCYLNPQGRVLLIQSNLAGLEETVKQFALHSMKAATLTSSKLPFFETLYLIEAKFAT
jgi:release factor glutamine methyltransferase